jgi:hypothetical protein
MTVNYVIPRPDMADLSHLPPSTPEEIRRMAAAAGLALSEPLMLELIETFPAFQAMVRRLPRQRSFFDEGAHRYDIALTTLFAAADARLRNGPGV